MSPLTVPTTEPQSFAIGETAQWRRPFGEYPPSDGWSLKYYFRGASTLDVTADGTGTDYLVTITPAATAGKTAGTYEWTAYAEKGTGPSLERRLYDRGVLTLRPDITAAADGVLQPHAERMLAAIEARLEGRVVEDMESFQIGGRNITQIPIAELLKLRAKYRNQLFRKRNNGAVCQRVTTVFRRS